MTSSVGADGHELAIGALLSAGFFVNETMVRKPWADVNALPSRNIRLWSVVTLSYTLTSVSNSSLVPNFLAAVGGSRQDGHHRASSSGSPV